MQRRHKKLIVLDFDGVIHSYESGWKGARNIPDKPVDGAIKWIDKFLSDYCTWPDSMCAMAAEGQCELAIFSSRARYWGGRGAMKKWLVRQGLDRRWLEVIKFPLWKPASTVLLDDRAIQFTGTFPNPKALIYFRPWNKPTPTT